LKKQSSTRIEVLETRATENKIQVLLANIGQGRALVNLNKTYFSGRPIGIRLLPRDFALNWIGEFQQGGGGGGPSNPSVDAWIKVMLPRYNPNAKLLDLSKLESEPLVIQHNLLGGRSFNKQICTVLIRIVSQQFPDIMSISFDNNYIEKLSDFGAMHKYLPNIQNLSFRNNRLMNIRDLEGLCTIGELPQLTELLLFDNPVRDLSIRKDGDDSTFRSNVSSMYPQLKQLDGGPCTPSIQFNLSVPGAANSKEFTPEILPSFYGSDMAMNTAAAFLSKFFVCLDSNRNSLYNVYDPSAFFSIDMSTFLFKPPKYPTGSKVKWGDYKSFNRNHTQPDISSSPSQRIAYGAQQILELLSKLPTTTHKVNDPSKVLVDSWMLPDLYPLGAGPGTRSGDYLYVVVHGEFTDSASGNLSRSFDRTFILKPALEGSPAMMDGWQVVIMSDSLTLRSYSNPKNFQPTPRESTPQPSTISSPQVAPSMPQSTPEQQNMLNVLHQKTGLNYQWTLNCLSSNNWNLEQAYQNFLQLQVTIIIIKDVILLIKYIGKQWNPP
jgi:nuclear RNA export factor